MSNVNVALRQEIRTMLDAGLTVRQIAKATDLSTQRVYQIKAILAAIDADKAEQEASV